MYVQSMIKMWKAIEMLTNLRVHSSKSTSDDGRICPELNVHGTQHS